MYRKIGIKVYKSSRQNAGKYLELREESISLQGTQPMENKSPQPTQKINLICITPDKKVFEGEVSMVVIPGEEGEFGVLPRHMSFVSLLKPGTIKIYQGHEITQTIAITGGVAEVNPQGCRILADGLAA